MSVICRNMHCSLLCCFVILTPASYKDRFSLLAESMEREKLDISVREKAQTKVTCLLVIIELHVEYLSLQQ